MTYSRKNKRPGWPGQLFSCTSVVKTRAPMHRDSIQEKVKLNNERGEE